MFEKIKSLISLKSISKDLAVRIGLTVAGAIIGGIMSSGFIEQEEQEQQEQEPVVILEDSQS